MHAKVLLAKHGDMEAQLSPLSEIVSPDVTLHQLACRAPHLHGKCPCKKTCTSSQEHANMTRVGGTLPISRKNGRNFFISGKP